MTYKVAILLASYNGELFLKKQLDSIINQLGADVSVFVSDDCSTDQTKQVVQSAQAECQNIHLLETKKNLGRSSQNFFNLIEKVDFSIFDFVAYADQDDFWFEDKLNCAINELINQNADGISTDVYALWPKTGKKKLIKKSFKQRKYDFWFEPPGPGCTHIMRAVVFENFKRFIITKKKKGIEEIDCHDWLTYAFFRYNGFKWVISSNPKMYYIQHSDNETGVNHGVRAAWKRLQLVRNRWYQDQASKVYLVLTNKHINTLLDTIKVKDILELRRRNLHSLLVFFLMKSLPITTRQHGF